MKTGSILPKDGEAGFGQGGLRGAPVAQAPLVPRFGWVLYATRREQGRGAIWAVLRSGFW
jgi:hypothetical protein